MSKKSEMQPKEMLGYGAKLGYGMGHILNDLCAAMWFSYALIFYNSVVELSSVDSGLVIFIGQVADAISTPLVGFFSDRGGSSRSSWLYTYGKRKTWHLIGTVCVVASMPFMYSPCIACQRSSEWIRLIYYSCFVALFQFGWASVQISHLALAPDLTSDERERTGLLSIRYTFTVLSSMSVYLITYIVLEVSGSDQENQLSPDDALRFQEITYIITGIGLITSIIFHITTKEQVDEPLLSSEATISERMSMKRIFSQPQLYLVAIIYMSIRLFGNINQSITPPYLHEALSLDAKSLAVIPFVVYLSSFLTSLINKPLNGLLGRKLTTIVGCIIGMGACVWTFLGVGEVYSKYLIYVVAALYGSATSILLVICTAVTADLIGNDIGNSAFIYGVMSFTDKLSSGAALMLIQSLKPPDNPLYYKYILSYVCGGSAVACFFTIIVLRFRTPEGSSEAV